MDIPLEFGGRRDGEPGCSMRARLDWSGLAARLAAAHATRQALVPRAGNGGTPSGSFAPACAPDVAAYLAAVHARPDHSPPDHAHPDHAGRTVNQIAKANGKHLSLREDAGGDDPLTRGLP